MDYMHAFQEPGLHAHKLLKIICSEGRGLNGRVEADSVLHALLINVIFATDLACV